ncbi:MAG: hypothetical protein ACKO7S_07200 [Actinomycetota bacterium]
MSVRGDSVIGMKAIYITEFGGPEVMKYVDLPEPVPAGSQALLDVTAIGINYADTHQTENSYLSSQSRSMIDWSIEETSVLLGDLPSRFRSLENRVVYLTLRN